MLVLSRKNGQKIIVNDNIVITVIESKFDNCKISIEAPQNVKIYREEVYEQIQLANKLSNDTSLESLDGLKTIQNISVSNFNDAASKLSQITIKKK